MGDGELGIRDRLIASVSTLISLPGSHPSSPFLSAGVRVYDEAWLEETGMMGMQIGPHDVTNMLFNGAERSKS